MAWMIERHDRVAIVTMNSHTANIQNEAFFVDLHAALDRLESEFSDCAVVLTSAGSCFSAGLDFETVFPILAAADAAAFEEFYRRYRGTNVRLWTFARPIVAAIDGAAYAGGVITALDCDYRICTPESRFCLNEVPIGIPMPEVYVEIIRYAVGTAAGSLTSLFGREYGATEALRLGLVHAVTPRAILLEQAIHMARAVPSDAFDAYAYTKRAFQAPFRERIDATSDARLHALLSSDGNVRARASRYEQIKGKPPKWAR
jgi:enoyl-CoA hydratase